MEKRFGTVSVIRRHGYRIPYRLGDGVQFILFHYPKSSLRQSIKHAVVPIRHELLNDGKHYIFQKLYHNVRKHC